MIGHSHFDHLFGAETIMANTTAKLIGSYETIRVLEAAGVAPRVEVTVQDDVLAITGERTFEKESNGKKYHRVERAYGRFLRSFTLPEDADGAKVMAAFKDGVLTWTDQHLFTPQAPTHCARVERGSARPARPKMLSCRYSGA